MRNTRALTRMRGWRGGLFGLAIIATAGCGDRAAKARAEADSSLSKDLALANQQTAVPTFQDTSVAPAPTPASHAKQQAPAPVHTASAPRHTPAPAPVTHTPAPQPAPVVAHVTQAAAPTPAAAPAAAPAEIGTGTGVALTSGSKVCTSSNLPGDKLVATVNSPVTGSNGAVIPAGSAVVLEVASVTPGQTADAAQITFRVRSVVVNDKTYNVAADVAPLVPLDRTKVANPDQNAEKKKVIGGAIAGAILGQMVGHNTKGTIIGAAAGAAAGAAVSKGGEKWEGCLPAGAPLRLTLSAPLVIS